MESSEEVIVLLERPVPGSGPEWPGYALVEGSDRRRRVGKDCYVHRSVKNRLGGPLGSSH